MPSTVTGLLLLVVVLLPGFVYHQRRESRVPGQQLTALRETAHIVSASFASLAVSLALLAVIRGIWPNRTPDVGAAMRQGEIYLRGHYLEFLVWGLVAVAISVTLSAVVAVPPRWMSSPLRRLLNGERNGLHAAIEQRQRAPIVPQSAWSAAFHENPEHYVYLGITLTDGTYVAGMLFSFNPEIEESSNRALVLSSPIQVQPPGKDDLRVLPGVGSMVISADQIRFLMVTYLEDEPEPLEDAGVADPSHSAAE